MGEMHPIWFFLSIFSVIHVQIVENISPQVVAMGVEAAAAGVDKALDLVDIIPGAKKYTDKIRPFVNTVGTIAGAVSGFGGNIASGISNFFGGVFGGLVPEQKKNEPKYVYKPNPENAKKIREGFAKMDQRLQSITRKAKDMLVLINDTIKEVIFTDMLQTYKEYQARLNMIDRRRSTFLGTPTKEHMLMFSQACNSFNAEGVLTDLEALVTGKTRINLMDILTNRVDNRNDLIVWITVVFGDAFRAAMLYHACLGTSTPLEETINTAAKRTETQLSQITNALRNVHDKRFEQIYTKNVTEWLEQNFAEAAELQQHLVKMFPFADWIVIRYHPADDPTGVGKPFSKFQSFDTQGITKIYVAWCEIIYSDIFPNVTVTDMFLQKIDNEIRGTYDDCSPTDISAVYAHLNVMCPAFFEARSQFLIQKANVRESAGGGKCGKYIDDVCGGKYVAAVTYGLSTE